MTARERIVHALSRETGLVCDDCLVTLGNLSSRQIANSTCSTLHEQGSIGRGRGTCGECGKAKIVNWSLPASLSEPEMPTKSEPPVSTEPPWYWEGHVQAKLVS
jgi:hypothetical protein